MKQSLLVGFFTVFQLMSVVSGQPYLLYHERSTSSTGCGTANYLNYLQPASTDSVNISFKVHSQLNAGQAIVYYTTDGSNPSGILGQGTGTTQVVMGVFGCSSNNYINVTGSVPALPSGTVVKYIFSVRASGTNYEVFGNSLACGGCLPITTSTNATLFTYSVQGVLPITFVNFTGREGPAIIRLFWASAQESNMDRYEIYRSRNSLLFEKAGTVAAIGNSPGRTDYFFTDQQPVTGNNYYKITAIDKSGKSVSTSIIRVLFGIYDNSVVVFSNPVSNIINVRVVDIVRGEYAIRVFDNSGKLIYNGKVQHNGADGVYPVVLPMPLARGNYRLVLTNKYQFYQSSFIIR
jgi:hypothetical protein